ncbi:MAG: DUF1844 domain-containing protein [Desulforhopalus sp.]|nr:DUF1844 domain-containing protein [Desulforhopalus sp.]
MTDQKKESAGDRDCCKGKVPNREGKCVMPEVTFSAFILSLNTSALYHLGDIADPDTGKTVVNLDLARNAIDSLTVIQNKTTGNLTNEEDQLLKSILYDAKLRFVQHVKKS